MTQFPVYKTKVARNSHKAAPRALNPAVVVGAKPDGTIPISLLVAPLVTVQYSTDMIVGSDIILHWDNELLGQGFGVIRIVGPNDNPLTTYNFEIDIAKFAPPETYSEHYVEYSVGDLASGTGVFSGFRIPVKFDRIMPGGRDNLAPLRFTPDQLLGITPAKLNANGELEVSLAPWFDMRAGDILTPWIGASDTISAGTFLPPQPEITDLDVGRDVLVKFPRSYMENLGNRVQWFGYKLKDRADNETTEAQMTLVRVPVLLTNVPGNLLSPVVPAYVDHNLVTDTDARDLKVHIMAYDNADPNDEIVCTWGGVKMPGAFVGNIPIPPPTPPTPLVELTLPYPLILTAAHVDPVLSLSYVVEINGTVAAGPAATTVAVDLTTPGGIVDPNPSTPEHEDLGPLVVVSDSGNGTGPDNTIPAGDFTKPAKITIPFLGVISNLPIWQIGDHVAVNWAPNVTLTGPDITVVNQDYELFISAANIAAGLVGLKEVTFILTRDLDNETPPNVGRATSGITPVRVQSSADLPNDGNDLGEVTFDEAIVVNPYIYPVVQRAAGIDGGGTTIQVPVNFPNVVVGDTIDLRFIGLGPDLLDDPAAPEMPATLVNITNQSISADDINIRGYKVLTLTTEQLLKVCRTCSKTTYTITNSAGPTPSVETFVNIAMRHIDPGILCLFPIPTIP
ncbi:hypothetical protein [Pseudomonas sp. NA-150]|uniref:hypothetical protein n=1 Tax=Pseudomonas sp. NA-150 TaxID=3367525 RepID=UPI0037CB5F06